MRRRLIAGSLAGVLVLTLLIIWAIGAWDYQTIGKIRTRRHVLRGVVEVEREGRYVAPFEIDPQAPSLTSAQLRSVTVSNLTWGEHGLLCGRVITAPGKPIKGRLVFGIEILETREGKRVRDRGLRATVDWPAGSQTDIVLSTDLSKPIRNQQTRLHLEPVL